MNFLETIFGGYAAHQRIGRLETVLYLAVKYGVLHPFLDLSYEIAGAYTVNRHNVFAGNRVVEIADCILFLDLDEL